MSKVIIFGIGRGAEVAYKYITRDSPHEVCAFTVDEKYLTANEFQGLPVVAFENIESAFSKTEYKMFIPLGFESMNRVRYLKYCEAKKKGYGFISYVHSSLNIIDPPNVGENCFILENQSINLDVTIGNNVVIWSGNQIGDSSVIMDNTWISSHVCIAGDVRIKPFCVIGINASISNNITIEEECYIGANAIIAKDTVPKGVYIVENTKKAALPSDKFMAIMKRSN
ncbi:MAG: acetyltransferase [Thermodesulfobacteriota bacterium]